MPQNPDPLTQAVLQNAFGKGNINLFSRPTIVNPDGSRSSLFSTSGEDDSGKEVLVPGVDEHGKGGQLSGDQAWKQYEDTWHFLGKFNSIPESDAYAEQLHNDAAQGYYTPPLATSRQSVDPNQLQKVLLFLLTGQK